MQEEWLKEKHALLKSIKEKKERLKDFEKVRRQQHFNPLPPQDDFPSVLLQLELHVKTSQNDRSKFKVSCHGREASSFLLNLSLDLTITSQL